MRADARQARWGDIALAGMAGADFTCRFLRIGRFGDAPSAGPSLWSPLAHFEDDIDFAMPVSEHTSSHTRATPGEEAAQASRSSGGARQGRAARRAAHLWALALSTLTRDRLNVRELQLDGGRIRLIWGRLPYQPQTG